jgi:hypothetical protein
MSKKILKNKIDWFIIDQVREKRLTKGLSQDDIGHIESPNFIAKYNTGHLNELAKLFKCSPKDFMPEKPL